MDFVLPDRPITMQLISGRGHYEAVIAAVTKAKCSVWIATANLKELMIEGRRVSVRSRSRYRSVLDTFDELARAGVELRILHASRPSRPFRESFDKHPRLYEGGLALRECPRVHLKTVIVDGTICYLGSANWTGAGIGAKGEGRRNFEVGIMTEDEGVLDTIQELYDRIWRGAECGACKLREDGCEAPLDLFGPERVITSTIAAKARATARVTIKASAKVKTAGPAKARTKGTAAKAKTKARAGRAKTAGTAKAKASAGTKARAK